MNRIHKKRLITTVALASGLALAGCSGGASPEESTPPPVEPPATTEPVETTTPEPSPTETGEALVIPDCEQLVPTETLQSHEHWENVQLFRVVPDPDLADVLPGELAQQTAASATQAYGCTFAAPQTDSGVEVDVLEIDPSERDTLVAALRQAPETYTETIMGDAVSFWTQIEGELGGLTLVYSFAGDAWVIQHGSLIDSERAVRIAEPVLESLREANPGLDER